MNICIEVFFGNDIIVEKRILLITEVFAKDFLLKRSKITRTSASDTSYEELKREENMV